MAMRIHQTDPGPQTTNRNRGPKTAAQDALQRARHEIDYAIASHAGEPDAWRQALHGKLRMLGRVFAIHVREAEAIDGSLQELLSLRPKLEHAVDLIKQEHSSIEAQRAILERIAAEPAIPDEKEIDFLRQSTGRLLESVRLHQAKGVDLLYEAFYRDDGGPG